jgi:hypothetical protein
MIQHFFLGFPCRHSHGPTLQRLAVAAIFFPHGPQVGADALAGLRLERLFRDPMIAVRPPLSRSSMSPTLSAAATIAGTVTIKRHGSLHNSSSIYL